MRKLSFMLFSTIIAFSLMLSACASSATPAPAATQARSLGHYHGNTEREYIRVGRIRPLPNDDRLGR